MRCVFDRCLNFGLYPAATIEITAELSWRHSKATGRSKVFSKNSWAGIASEKSPDPNEIISASVVLLAVAVCLREDQPRGNHVDGPSMVITIPEVDFVCSMPEQ